MRQTTELERKKTALLKTARAAIRLKHSLAADDEIARVLPELEQNMDDALARGEQVELMPGDLFDVD